MQDATDVNYDNTTTAATPECGAKEAQPNQSPSKLVGSGSSGSASGVESSPVWRGSFDFYRERGPYQVRIHLWGWPAKVLWRILSPRWKIRGYTPTPEGEVLPQNTKT